jgi:hypothetical protein
MAYFAQLDENNYVTNVYSVNDSVIIENGIENETLGEIFLNTTLNTQMVYKRTSYNTLGGIHYQADSDIPSPNQSKALRKNYAGIGFTYDSIRDAFIPPKSSYPSWVLDEVSCQWKAPILYPDISSIPLPFQLYNNYFWNEDGLNWKLRKPFRSWVPIGTPMSYYYISPIPYPMDGNNYRWDENESHWTLK